MTVHSLYPAFVKFYYTVSTIQHVATWPVVPSTGWVVGDEPEVQNNAGGSTLFSTAMGALMPLIQPFFATTADLQRAEVWWYPTEEEDPIWLYTHTVGLPGTGGAVTTLMQQAVISFRTQGGHGYRFYLMETSSNIAPNGRTSYPFGAGSATNLASYMTGANGWIVGRDTAKLVVPIWFTTKYNDALRKKRLNL